jgi:hypothetical protein
MKIRNLLPDITLCIVSFTSPGSAMHHPSETKSTLYVGATRADIERALRADYGFAESLEEWASGSCPSLHWIDEIENQRKAAEQAKFEAYAHVYQIAKERGLTDPVQGDAVVMMDNSYAEEPGLQGVVLWVKDERNSQYEIQIRTADGRTSNYIGRHGWVKLDDVRDLIENT